jgi:hypothetical protein
MSAYEYYREMKPEINKKDVKSYISSYKGSSEEERDLLEYYEEHGGDVKMILECIIASENADVPRFIEFFEKQIKIGVIKETVKFKNSKKKVKLMEDERDEAKEVKKEKKL